MMVLNYEGRLRVYKLRYFPDTGVLKAFNHVSHHVSHWLGNKATVTPMSRAVAGMVRFGEQVGEISEDLPIPDIFFSVDNDVYEADVTEDSTAELVAWTFSTQGDPTPPDSVVTEKGGEVALFEKEVGGQNVMIGFDTGEAITLPPMSLVRPFIKKGTRILPGTVVADLVPRKDYTIKEVREFDTVTLDMCLKHVLNLNSVELANGQLAIDYRLVRKDQRLGVDFGGAVTGTYEVSPSDRTPVKSISLSRDTDFGQLDFWKDQYLGHPRRR
jgi:hypothetical protein